MKGKTISLEDIESQNKKIQVKTLHCKRERKLKVYRITIYYQFSYSHNCYMKC